MRWGLLVSESFLGAVIWSLGLSESEAILNIFFQVVMAETALEPGGGCLRDSSQMGSRRPRPLRDDRTEFKIMISVV